MAQFLPKIFEISNFLDRCTLIARNLVQQLSSLISDKKTIIQSRNSTNENNSNNNNNGSNKNKKIDKKNDKNGKNENSLLNTHLFSAYRALGDVLSIFLLFDSVILDNDVLRASWEGYKVVMRIARSDPGVFGGSEAEGVDFERALVSIDERLFKGTWMR